MKKVSATLEKVLITPQGANFSEMIEQGVCTFEGLLGDRHSGLTMRSGSRQPEYPRGTEIRNRRQISILSLEELQQIASDLDIPEIDPSWLAGNLLISGIPNLTQLPPSARFFFQGGAVLVNDGENHPCSTVARSVQEKYPQVDHIRQNFVKAAMHRRGLVAWVEHPGTLTPGSSCELEVPDFGPNLW